MIRIHGILAAAAVSALITSASIPSVVSNGAMTQTIVASAGYSAVLYIDVDRDGVRDILTTDQRQRVLVFRNIGSDSLPVFTNPVMLRLTSGTDITPNYAGAFPWWCDWNGDNLPDLLIGQNPDVHLFTNATATVGAMPSFGDAGSIPALDAQTNIVTSGDDRTCIQALSYDGTSSNDLLVAFGFNIRWYKNIGTYQAPVLTNMGTIRQQSGAALSFSFSPVPRCLDWNGDGTNELIVGDMTQLNIFSSTGRPPVWTLVRQTSLDRPQLYFAPADAGDFNGDGRRDLVFGDMIGGITVATNTGTTPLNFAGLRQLTAPRAPFVFGNGALTPSICLWDGNGDGLLDVLLCRPLSTGDRLYLNAGSALNPVFTGFETRSLVNGSGFQAVSANGKQYLYSRDSILNSWGLQFYINSGSYASPQFSWCATPISNVHIWMQFAVADWDGDARLDVLLYQQCTNWFYRNTTSNELPCYAAPVPVIADGAPLVFADNFAKPCVIDWDSDGDADLLMQRDGGFIGYYENTNGSSPVLLYRGALTADTSQISWGGGAYKGIAAADMDGDGFPNLAVGFTDGTVRWYEAVPEPAAACVLALCLLAAMRRRRT